LVFDQKATLSAVFDRKWEFSTLSAKKQSDVAESGERQFEPGAPREVSEEFSPKVIRGKTKFWARIDMSA
jgi:hypothetical protein